MRTLIWICGFMGLATMTAGCTVSSADAVNKFREPIPASSDVALSVPKGDAVASEHTMVFFPQAVENKTSYAKYYQSTRNVADAVDWGTGFILARVWVLVHLPPTSIQGNEATWGPGQGDALSPVVWKFVVTEVSPGVFDYKLAGRPKQSTSDADFVAVLSGRGYGRTDPRHRQGTFSIDNDAQRALDPSSTRDKGTMDFAYDLRQWPATIGVKLHKGSDGTSDIQVTHRADRSGAVDITAHGDIEDVPDGRFEDVVLHSRWASSGAGRADITMSGGDLPTGIQATQCWTSAFISSYYEDSANYEPTTGSAATCVFPNAL